MLKMKGLEEKKDPHKRLVVASRYRTNPTTVKTAETRLKRLKIRPKESVNS